MCAYKLSNLIRARFPMIYIPTFEEDRVTKYIKSIATDEKQVKFPREVFTWTETAGLYSDTQKKTISDTTSPCKLLEFIRKYDNDGGFILLQSRSLCKKKLQYLISRFQHLQKLKLNLTAC